MPTFRIYYAEREVRDPDRARSLFRTWGGRIEDAEVIGETDWEEEVEARDGIEAVEAFFRDHVKGRSDVMEVGEDGRARSIEGIADYNPEATYIWIENGKLMEYQGLDEATPGMVTCPLCDGAGEVDEELAEEFLAEYGEEGEEGEEP